MEALSKIAHRRLYPPLSDPGYLTLRSRRLIFSAWARQFQNQHLTVLDVGGRYQPYRPLFESCAERYYGVDLIKTEFVKVVADGEALPFAPGTIDLIIATQVFEYFRNPAQAAQGMHAALKPGGILLASFAACTPRFAEEELWRFTPAGLRLMLAPFATVETIPELHSLGGLIRILNQGLDKFVRYQSARRVYQWTIGPVLNLLGLGCEKLKLTSNDQFTTNFSVKAVKGSSLSGQQHRPQANSILQERTKSRAFVNGNRSR